MRGIGSGGGSGGASGFKNSGGTPVARNDVGGGISGIGGGGTIVVGCAITSLKLFSLRILPNRQRNCRDHIEIRIEGQAANSGLHRACIECNATSGSRRVDAVDVAARLQFAHQVIAVAQVRELIKALRIRDRGKLLTIGIADRLAAGVVQEQRDAGDRLVVAGALAVANCRDIGLGLTGRQNNRRPILKHVTGNARRRVQTEIVVDAVVVGDHDNLRNHIAIGLATQRTDITAIVEILRRCMLVDAEAAGIKTVELVKALIVRCLSWR